MPWYFTVKLQKLTLVETASLQLFSVPSARLLAWSLSLVLPLVCQPHCHAALQYLSSLSQVYTFPTSVTPFIPEYSGLSTSKSAKPKRLFYPGQKCPVHQWSWFNACACYVSSVVQGSVFYQQYIPLELCVLSDLLRVFPFLHGEERREKLFPECAQRPSPALSPMTASLQRTGSARYQGFWECKGSMW